MGIIKGIKIESMEVPKLAEVKPLEKPIFEFRAENFSTFAAKDLTGDLAESGVRLKEMTITPDLKQSGARFMNLSLSETRSRPVISPQRALAAIVLAGAAAVMVSKPEIGGWVADQIRALESWLGLGLLPLMGMVMGRGNAGSPYPDLGAEAEVYRRELSRGSDLSDPSRKEALGRYIQILKSLPPDHPEIESGVRFLNDLITYTSTQTNHPPPNRNPNFNPKSQWDQAMERRWRAFREIQSMAEEGLQLLNSAHKTPAPHPFFPVDIYSSTDLSPQSLVEYQAMIQALNVYMGSPITRSIEGFVNRAALGLPNYVNEIYTRGKGVRITSTAVRLPNALTLQSWYFPHSADEVIGFLIRIEKGEASATVWFPALAEEGNELMIGIHKAMESQLKETGSPEETIDWLRTSSPWKYRFFFERN